MQCAPQRGAMVYVFLVFKEEPETVIGGTAFKGTKGSHTKVRSSLVFEKTEAGWQLRSDSK